MFQSFTETARPEQGPPRLANLRRAMAEAGLAGFLVPRADAHQGEYVAACDARLAWLTGFTGSAGFCAVLGDAAGVLSTAATACRSRRRSIATISRRWTGPKRGLAPGSRRICPRAARWGSTRGSTPPNRSRRCARIWPKRHPPRALAQPDRPDLDGSPRPAAGRDHALARPSGGATHAEKRAQLAETLRAAGQRAAVITLADSLAWLFNIRGADIPRNPVPQGFAILHDDGRAALFTDPAKLDADRARISATR